jgi:hypothetical protein
MRSINTHSPVRRRVEALSGPGIGHRGDIVFEALGAASR